MGDPNGAGIPSGKSWRVDGASVRGASHVRSGAPNQDAISWLPASGSGTSAALSVADGHGSPRSFRSDVGAALANRVALALADELLRLDLSSVNLGLVRERLIDDVPRRLVRDWRLAVDVHLAALPFTEAELDEVRQRDGEAGVGGLLSDPYVAYGTTLVTTVVTPAFLAAWQVGDGDVLAMSADGRVTRPVPTDDRLIANETTSMCSQDAWRLFRVVLVREPSPLVLLSTDGLVNSFVDDAGMQRFGSDIERLVRDEGFDSIAARVPEWLEQLTKSGSGDDISLGLLWCADLLVGDGVAEPETLPAEPPTADDADRQAQGQADGPGGST